MEAAYSEAAICQAIATATVLLGYSELRPKQEQAARLFLQGNDVFVCLPTGSGKSLCYCLLPKAFDLLRNSQDESTQSLVVVISPLIALMKDQVRSMTARDISAVYAGEADGDVEVGICSGKYQLVFMSPESLLNDDRWRDMLQSPIYQERLVGIVVDEAHCVKKW